MTDRHIHQPPLVGIVRGAPKDTEVAALVAALQLMVRPPEASETAEPAPRSPWARPLRYQPPGSWFHRAH